MQIFIVKIRENNSIVKEIRIWEHGVLVVIQMQV